MRTFTDAQLQKLTTKPYWIQNSPFFSSRVFAGSEGWMIQPTKVHPDPTKQLPPYCLVAIPNLDQLIEGAGVSGATYVAQAASDLFYTNVSATRRSATRYMVSVSLGEEVKATGGSVVFTLDTAAVGGINSLDATYLPLTYTLNDGQSTGRIQFDLRFTSLDDLSVQITGRISISGTGTLVDSSNNSFTGSPQYSWNATDEVGIDPANPYQIVG